MTIPINERGARLLLRLIEEADVQEAEISEAFRLANGLRDFLEAAAQKRRTAPPPALS